MHCQLEIVQGFFFLSFLFNWTPKYICTLAKGWHKMLSKDLCIFQITDQPSHKQCLCKAAINVIERRWHKRELLPKRNWAIPGERAPQTFSPIKQTSMTQQLLFPLLCQLLWNLWKSCSAIRGIIQRIKSQQVLPALALKTIVKVTVTDANIMFPLK